MRSDTETTCHCGAAYNGSDHCPECGCEQYESYACEVAIYSIQKQRPHTGWVCHGETRIGTVTAQTRGVRKSDGRSRFYTATPISAEGVGYGSIGTRYPSQMAAARALWLFHREFGLPEGWAELSFAIGAYRNRYDVTPGKRGICEHVAA